MKTPWEIKIGNIAQYLAIGSFTIGTLLFILGLITKNNLFNNGTIIILGLIYVIIAVLINIIYLLFLIANLFITKNHHLFLIKKGFIMLSNIPIAIIYYSLLFII